MKTKRTWVIIVPAIILVGLLPIGMYYLILGNVPSIQSSEALELLNQQELSVVLIDVRTQKEYKQEHIDGAINWPLESIKSTITLMEFPSEFAEKTLLLICTAGFKSAEASRYLNALGKIEAFNVVGGMQEWVKVGALSPDKAFSHFISAGSTRHIPFTQLTTSEQVVPVLSGFVIKPIHMLLSLFLIIILWKNKESDLNVLRWGIFLFLAGETFCAINFLFFNDESIIADYLHNYGMALGFGFVIYALLEGVDKRIAKISVEKRPCSLISLCGKCSKSNAVPCRLQQLFLWICIGFAVVALLPLLVEIQTDSYVTLIFNTLHQYTHLAVFQYFEYRFIPVFSVACFISAYLLQIFNKDTIIPQASRILFSGGAGALLFGFFRLLLNTAFIGQLHWSDFWEETTEFLFILFIALSLWYFKEQLIKAKTNATSAIFLQNSQG
jgi:rhodanese-related sulfurtransferase